METLRTKTSWDRLDEAIASGGVNNSLHLAEKCGKVSIMQQDSLVSFAAMALTSLAVSCGEPELEKFFRERYGPQAKSWIETTPDARGSAERLAVLLDSPKTKITLVEELDRYVLTPDPCRTGGRLRKGVSCGSVMLPGVKIGETKRAYPWSWGKKGVCYYCVHDCLLMEIIPIELRGYPIAVVEYGEKAGEPCSFLFYKEPGLIPEEYFTRVGKVKVVK